MTCCVVCSSTCFRDFISFVEQKTPARSSFVNFFRVLRISDKLWELHFKKPQTPFDAYHLTPSTTGTKLIASQKQIWTLSTHKSVDLLCALETKKELFWSLYQNSQRRCLDPKTRRNFFRYESDMPHNALLHAVRRVLDNLEHGSPFLTGSGNHYGNCRPTSIKPTEQRIHGEHTHI